MNFTQYIHGMFYERYEMLVDMQYNLIIFLNSKYCNILVLNYYNNIAPKKKHPFFMPFKGYIHYPSVLKIKNIFPPHAFKRQ